MSDVRVPKLAPFTTTASRLELVERFFAGTGPSYDWIVNATTLGADRRWKRAIVDAIPAHAERILDLASGTGILTFAIAERFPGARVVGVELRDEYLQLARRRAAALGYEGVQFVLSRAEDYAPAEPCDAIVSSYLAKYAELPALARNGRAMLRPGGVLVMHDFSYPSTPRTERYWKLQFAAIRLLGATAFRPWRTAFDGLPELIRRTRWVAELPECLRREGFRDIRVEELSKHGATMVSARV